MTTRKKRSKPPAVWAGKKVGYQGQEFRVSSVWNTNTEGRRVDMVNTRDPNDRRSAQVSDLDRIEIG